MKPLLFGKYCLLERISVGGMAEVFRAKPFDAPGFQGYLALKRILPHLAEDDEFIKMFVDEAKLTVQLSHPNIVRIFELGKFQSSYYILMEYISGKDLLNVQKTVRKRREIFGVRTAAQVAANVASGLHHAHFMTDKHGQPLNIIHRDISPQNILVDFFGNVKVIDFGIAKAAVQSTRTQVGVLKGKMGYMSPEQVSGQKLDHRSDIFAIGTVFWELVTNRRLFNGDNEFETMNLVKEADVEPPSVHNPDIPPEVDRIILKALAADREERYASAGELAQELEVWLRSVGYNHQELSNWMCDVYSDELAAERDKREQFDSIQTPDDVRRIIEESARKKSQQGSAAAPQPSNEEKTEIWDASILPDADQSLTDFAAQHTVVQAGGFDASAFASGPGQVSDKADLTAPDPGHAANPPGFTHNTPGAGQSSGQHTELQGHGTDPGAPQKSSGSGILKWIVALLVMVLLALGGTIVGLFYFNDDFMGQQTTDGPRPTAAGTIVVNVTPPAGISVILDGNVVGNSSPVTIPDVAPGEHVVEVTGEGFATASRTIVLESRGLEPLEIELEPTTPAVGRVSLTIPKLDDNVAASLQLFVDGKRIDRTSAEEGVELAAGTHLVEALADGHRPFSTLVELERDEETTVEPVFEPQRLRLSFPEGATVELDGDSADGPVDLSPTKLHELNVSGDDGSWKGLIGFPAMGMGQFKPAKIEEGAEEGDFGWLTITTGDDWWSVLIDGYDTGLVTPVAGASKIPVRAGDRRITLKRGLDRRDITVDVRPGETVVLRKKLNFVFEKDGS